MPLHKSALTLIQPPPESWLVNAQWKPEDSPLRTQMYPLFCHPYPILLTSIVAILFA
jgi:hypothetical protein